jgi:hypothetical protein
MIDSKFVSLIARRPKLPGSRPGIEPFSDQQELSDVGQMP